MLHTTTAHSLAGAIGTVSHGTEAASVSNLETALNSALNTLTMAAGLVLLLLAILAAATFIIEKQQYTKIAYAVEAVRRSWPKLSQEQQREKVEE